MLISDDDIIDNGESIDDTKVEEEEDDDIEEKICNDDDIEEKINNDDESIANVSMSFTFNPFDASNNDYFTI